MITNFGVNSEPQTDMSVITTNAGFMSVNQFNWFGGGLSFSQMK